MNKTFFILLVLTTLFSCNKDQDGPSGKTYVKVLSSDSKYIGRAIDMASDGSVYLAAVAQEIEANGLAYGVQPPIIVKYNAIGQVIWKKKISGIVHNLWRFKILGNGNLLTVGLDSTRSSQNVGLQILDSEGRELFRKTFFNQTTPAFGNFGFPYFDILELSSGNIALLLYTLSVQNNNQPTLHLKILNQSLDEVYDHIFIGDDEFPSSNTQGPFTLSENEDGSLLIFYNSGSKQWECIQLSAKVYQPLNLNTFSSVNEEAYSASVNPTFNQAVIPFTGGSSLVNLRNQESYSTGKTVQLRLGPSGELVKEISGFPGSAFISRIKSTSDGGYILAGTCNIRSADASGSQFRPLLIKLDNTLNMRWMQTYSTSVPTLVNDVTELNDGYALSATFRSIDGLSKAGVIKTDINGDL